jgi:sugar phosphate isomerase/epimerase
MAAGARRGAASGVRTGMTVPDTPPNVSGFAAKLDEMERLRLDTVEVPFYSLDLLVGVKRDALRCRRLLEACRSRPFGFTAHLPLSINFFAEGARAQWHFDVFRASLDLAVEARAENAVIHTGMHKKGAAGDEASAYARQREMLTRAGDEAKARGCYVCVENLFGWDGYETALAGKLADELSAVAHPHVRATLDFSHAYINCAQHGADFIAEIAKLSTLARHAHVHDSFGRPDTGMYFYRASEAVAFGAGDLHLCIGRGSLPWDAALAACEFPPDAIFNIELDDRYFDDEASDCVAAARALAAKARQRG